MPLFTPVRKQTCPSCSAELEAKVTQNFKLFADVDDTVNCPGCKTRLWWRPQPFFFQDLAVVLFGCSLLCIEFPIVGAVVLLGALCCYYYGEATMKLEKGRSRGSRSYQPAE